jgi:hypothetical protein
LIGFQEFHYLLHFASVRLIHSIQST